MKNSGGQVEHQHFGLTALVEPQGRFVLEHQRVASALRLADGALPTLIEWGATHPATRLPEAGLHLEGLRLGGAHGAAVQSALQTLGMSPCCPLDTDHRKPALAVSIGTPRGTVLLTCPSAVR